MRRMPNLFVSRPAQHAALATLALLAAEPDSNALAQLRPPSARVLAMGQMPDPVLQLASSRPFLDATPHEQLSLLHALQRTITPWPAEAQAAPLIERLISICDSPLYGKLTQQDRVSVMRLASLDIPLFESLFFKAPRAEAQDSSLRAVPLRPEDLSDSRGERMFARLERLADTPITLLGSSGRLAARQLISIVIDPSSLRQHANTCFPTVLVHHLASTAPAEYIRLSHELIFNGRSTTNCGLELTVHTAWLDRAMDEPYGFSARNLLPWALFQALHGRPLADLEREAGLAELPPGPDVARFIGCHTDLRVRDNPERWRPAPGDILFIVGNEQNRGHVLQLKALHGDQATVYDPAGPTSVRALVSALLGLEARLEVHVNGPYARIPRGMLDRITQTSYRFAPCPKEAPSFALLREERRVQVFPDREAVNRFIDKTSEGKASPGGKGFFSSLILLAGMATLAAYRFISRPRTP